MTQCLLLEGYSLRVQARCIKPIHLLSLCFKLSFFLLRIIKSNEPGDFSILMLDAEVMRYAYPEGYNLSVSETVKQ